MNFTYILLVRDDFEGERLLENSFFFGGTFPEILFGEKLFIFFIGLNSPSDFCGIIF